MSQSYCSCIECGKNFDVSEIGLSQICVDCMERNRIKMTTKETTPIQNKVRQTVSGISVEEFNKELIKEDLAEMRKETTPIEKTNEELFEEWDKSSGYYYEKPMRRIGFLAACELKDKIIADLEKEQVLHIEYLADQFAKTYGEKLQSANAEIERLKVDEKFQVEAIGILQEKLTKTQELLKKAVEVITELKSDTFYSYRVINKFQKKKTRRSKMNIPIHIQEKLKQDSWWNRLVNLKKSYFDIESDSPNTMIIDEGSWDMFKEEFAKQPIEQRKIFSNLDVLIVPRIGRSEIEFIRRIKTVNLD